MTPLALTVFLFLIAVLIFWSALFSGLETALFSLMFKLLPDVKMAWHDVWLGAAMTSLMFTLGKIAIGIYFSPDDFWWLHQHGIPINRQVKGIYPQDIPEFMDYTRRQLRELLTGYGKIDYFFFDGPAEQLTDYAWSLQPNLVITRGVMETPEQYIPGVPLKGAWEGNLTMGT